MNLPYAKYLRTEHWKSVRRWALERADNRCQMCSSGHRLQVHHNNYENLGHERPADVIVLCDSCHGKHHDNMEKSPVFEAATPERLRVYPNPQTLGDLAAKRFRDNVEKVVAREGAGSRGHVKLLWDRAREVRRLHESGSDQRPLNLAELDDLAELDPDEEPSRPA